MKIEVLYPELCNLFGDSANMRYLALCLPEAEFVSTHLENEPAFLSEHMDMVYMGPATENTQEKIIAALMPYKDRIKAEIDSGTLFFFTGNALEIFGDYIECDDGKKIPALGIFDYYAKRDMLHRHNSECLAQFENMKIMGFKTQFTMCYPAEEKNSLFAVIKGMGMNIDSKAEGIRVNNFFGTYLVGPLLVLNPCFTEYLIKLMGVKKPQLAFEEIAKKAYDKRLADFYKNVPDNVGKYKYM